MALLADSRCSGSGVSEGSEMGAGDGRRATLSPPHSDPAAAPAGCPQSLYSGHGGGISFIFILHSTRRVLFHRELASGVTVGRWAMDRESQPSCVRDSRTRCCGRLGLDRGAFAESGSASRESRWQDRRGRKPRRGRGGPRAE